jgi:hypothetical protein
MSSTALHSFWAFGIVVSLVVTNAVSLALPIPVSTPSARSRYPVIAVDGGGTIHVAWHNDAQGGIFTARSNDNGASFTVPDTVSTGGINPAITVTSSGRVLVVWRDSSPYYTFSTDGGVTFSSPLPLSNKHTDRLNITTAPSGVVSVVYFGSDATAFYQRSIDDGVTFSAPVPLSTGSMRSYYPDVAAVGSDIVTPWFSLDTPDPNGAMMYARSSDGGATFAPAVSLDPGNNQGPHVSASPGGVFHLVWSDGSTNNSLAYSRSSDGGATFEAKRVLTPSWHSPIDVIAPDDTTVVVLVSNPPSVPDLYTVTSVDGGATFGTLVNLTKSPGSWNVNGALALLGNGAIGAVWEEDVTGTPRILFDIVGNGDVGVHGPGIPPIAFRLRPNPSQGRLTLEFTLQRASNLEIGIYDVRGRKVKTISRGFRAAGPHLVKWDGQGENGNEIPAGVYFVRLSGEVRGAWRFARVR